MLHCSHVRCGPDPTSPLHLTKSMASFRPVVEGSCEDWSEIGLFFCRISQDAFLSAMTPEAYGPVSQDYGGVQFWCFLLAVCICVHPCSYEAYDGAFGGSPSQEGIIYSMGNKIAKITSYNITEEHANISDTYKPIYIYIYRCISCITHMGHMGVSIKGGTLKSSISKVFFPL